MLTRQLFSLFTAWAFALLVTTPSYAAPKPPDTVAPRVLHEVVPKGVLGTAIEVSAKLEDESGIFEPKVYFRRIGETEFNAIDMLTKPNGYFVATIPATLVTRDIEYFVEAFDTMGNGPARHGAPERPHFIKVSTKVDAPPGSGARDLSTDTARMSSAVQPMNGTAAPVDQPSGGSDSIVTKWWFWTIIVAVAAGATVGVLCATKTGICADSAVKTFDPVTIRVSGGDARDGL